MSPLFFVCFIPWQKQACIVIVLKSKGNFTLTFVYLFFIRIMLKIINLERLYLILKDFSNQCL